MTGVVKSPSLPDHPILAAWASALNETGNWAQIVDANWRYVFVTDELSVTRQALGLPAVPIGAHLLSAEGVQAELGGSWPSPEVRRAWFLTAGRYVLASTPGGREELRRIVHPEFADLVDELQSLDMPVVAVLAPLRERAAALGVVAAGSTASGANVDLPDHSDHVSDRGQPRTRCRLLCGDQAGGGDVLSRRRDREGGLGASRTDARR